jgi:arsenate reductase-like glutaredoxin family protein
MGRKDIQSTLKLSQEQFEALHSAHNKTRSTSKTVTVDRAALIAILMDHSNMVERLERLE